MRLILFDCDGTLVDSQNTIVSAMDAAFAGAGLTPPGRQRTLGVVGLSLPEAFAVLAPRETPELRADLAELYRKAAQQLRLTLADDPLYPGADAAVRALASKPETALGMATGKSMRGVHRTIAHNAWDGLFQTLQTADNNPSKPHPGMIERALADTGADRDLTVMIGDTAFDMAMAKAAGVAAIGVSWGYHPVKELTSAGASVVVESFDELVAALAWLDR